MDQEQFKACDGPLDEINEILVQTLQSAELQKVRDILATMSKHLGRRYSVTLHCVVEVFDDVREQALPLLNTGLLTSNGAEPRHITGDSSPQRYIVDGEIHVVPHDHCPKCWGVWDFKLQNPSCPCCDAKLGEDCKLLLDSDVCPHCEKGQVSDGHLKCAECGFEVDPSFVAWG